MTENKKPAATTNSKEDAENKPLAVLERELVGHEHWVRTIAVSPNGQWAASGGSDKTIKIWDLETGKCRASLKGHKDKVNCVAISADGQQLVSAGNDSLVRIWRARDGRPEKIRIIKGVFLVLSAAFVPRSHDILYVGAYSAENLQLWNVDDDSLRWSIREIAESDSPVAKGVVVTRDGKHAFAAFHSGEIMQLELKRAKRIAVFTAHSASVNSIAITPDDRFIVSGSDDKTLKIWDIQTWTCVGTLEGHQSNVHSVAVSPDGTLIASTGFTDETVRLWDFKSGECLQVIRPGINPTPLSVTFNPDGSQLLVGTTLGRIYVYRLSAAPHTRTVESAKRYVNAKVVLIGEE